MGAKCNLGLGSDNLVVRCPHVVFLSISPIVHRGPSRVCGEDFGEGKYAERRAKEEHRRQPCKEAKSLPNTPPADPTCHALLVPRDEPFRESDTLSEIGNTRSAAPSREQTCAPVAADAGRVCAPLIFAESALTKGGNSPEFARCSRGSRSVVESSFITMRQFAGGPQM